MNSKLTVLYDLKYKYEKKYEELEEALMDDEIGKYEFSLIMQQMSGLRIAIRILEDEVVKGTK